MLNLILGLALVVSLFSVAYIAVTPQQQSGEEFTEFYVLGPDGTASDYPTDLSVGETGTIIVGVTNQEYTEMTYTVALLLEDKPLETQTITLAHGETWEESFSVTPERTGRLQLGILLYEGESADFDDEPYRDLQLWLEVSE